MNTRTIVTVIAAALFSVSLVPVSSAQDTNGSMPDGIEVITIIGKRPVPTVATVCLEGAATHQDVTGERQNPDGTFGEVLESGRIDITSPRRAI